MLWRKTGDRRTTSQTQADSDAVAQLARLIYGEMDVEPRHMHLAIELAREQLQALRDLLVVKGLRRTATRDS